MGGGITLKSGTPIKLHGIKGVGIALDDLSWAILVKINQSTTILYKQAIKQEVHVKSKKDDKLHTYTAFAVNNGT